MAFRLAFRIASVLGLALGSVGYANAWDVVQWGMLVDIVLFAPMYSLGLFLFIRRVQGTANPLAVSHGTSRRMPHWPCHVSDHTS